MKAEIFRKSLVGFVVAVGFSVASQAQVSVYGFYNNYTDPENPLVLGQYEAISGEWLELDTLDFASAVVLGSSAFDAGSESYMFAGIGVPMETAGMGFWDYNVIENEVLNNPSFNQTINGIQHDMAQDKLFALGTYPVDSTYVDFGGGWGYWEYEWGSQLIELNPDSGTVYEIAPIDGINGVILGATAFDSDNGIYALVGMDDSYNQKFIQLDAMTGAVISATNLQLPPNWGFNELECYVAGDSYIGIMRPYGNPDNPPSTPAALVTVNASTGMLTPILELPQIFAFTPNASVFEQVTGYFIMLYYDINYQTHVLVVDPQEAEVVADHLIEGSFIELQINNREFMLASYGEPTGMDIAAGPTNLSIQCSPNPATNRLHVSCDGDYRVFNLTGEQVMNWTDASQIDVNDWTAGTYIVQSRAGLTASIVVTH